MLFRKCVAHYLRQHNQVGNSVNAKVLTLIAMKLWKLLAGEQKAEYAKLATELQEEPQKNGRKISYRLKRRPQSIFRNSLRNAAKRK
jgi:hypothetical protein